MKEEGRMNNQKAYKLNGSDKGNMLPGDLKGLPDESFFDTLVFIDANFLSKVSKHFGGEKYLVYDLVKLSNNLSRKQKLRCKQIFYYTAPPFQSQVPTKEEERKKWGYDKFTKKIKEYGILVREGRCQRLKIDNKFEYKQKAVDILLAMDLMSVPLEFPRVKRIILIASDSDFVPVVKNLRQKGIKTILYTYYERKRNTNFSRSNYLIKSVHKYKILSIDDFEEAQLNKNDKI
jgi:uncharacterized LabA/DUF88 family protein